MMRTLHRPVVLVGPPGSGKTTLGRRASNDLGLRFNDLADDGGIVAMLDELVRHQVTDIVALPWAPTSDASWLAIARRRGETVALWAHPLEMQRRSGRTERLFTPVPRLKTFGGFGRTGIGCREYRHLARSCGHVLDLVGLSEDDAVRDVVAIIEDLRMQDELTPTERVGIGGWADNWRADFNADHKACTILVDAMARFALAVKARGASPRTISGILSDLNAAGFLTMSSGPRNATDILQQFASGPSRYEYGRKLTDSPRAFARFESTWSAFSTFLRESGLLVIDA